MPIDTSKKKSMSVPRAKQFHSVISDAIRGSPRPSVMPWGLVHDPVARVRFPDDAGHPTTVITCFLEFLDESMHFSSPDEDDAGTRPPDDPEPHPHEIPMGLVHLTSTSAYRLEPSPCAPSVQQPPGASSLKSGPISQSFAAVGDGFPAVGSDPPPQDIAAHRNCRSSCVRRAPRFSRPPPGRAAAPAIMRRMIPR